MAFDWGKALAGAGRGMQQSTPLILQALMAQQEQSNWDKKFNFLRQQYLDEQSGGAPTSPIGMNTFGVGDYQSSALTRHLQTQGGEPVGVDPTALQQALAAQEQINPLDILKLKEKEIDIKTKEAKLNQLLNPKTKTKQKYDYLETAKYEDYQKYVAKQEEDMQPVKPYPEWARGREHSPTAGAGRDVIFGRTGARQTGGEQPLTPEERAELEMRRKLAGK